MFNSFEKLRKPNEIRWSVDENNQKIREIRVYNENCEFSIVYRIALHNALKSRHDRGTLRRFNVVRFQLYTVIVCDHCPEITTRAGDHIRPGPLEV